MQTCSLSQHIGIHQSVPTNSLRLSPLKIRHKYMKSHRHVGLLNSSYFNRNYDYGLQRLRKQRNRNKTIIFLLLLLLFIGFSVELYLKFRVINC